MMLIFFMNVAMSSMVAGEIDFQFFFQTTFILQVVCIALPATLMALLFTSNRKKTLLLDHWPRWQLLFAAALLAVLVRPLGVSLAEGIQHLYPVSEELELQLEGMSHLLDAAPNPWLPYVLIALLPAFCEEIAFRGFVLSGLRHVGHKWWAIALSSVAFGMVHPVLQQQIAAVAVGLVLGYLAVQTGSLLVCMVFHAVYNALALVIAELSAPIASLGPETWQSWIFRDVSQFQPWVLVFSALGSIAILLWLHHLPYDRTKEEQLQEARERTLSGA
jgi:sodium transport system permease protein